MSTTNGLLDLQTIDLQHAQAAARLGRVAAALADGGALAAAEASLKDATTARDAAAKQLKAVQQERQALKAHIQAEEGRLYGGQVKAPKELQGIQRELESLRRQLAARDDAALEAMLADDTTAERLAAGREALAATQARAAEDHVKLTEERERLSAALAHLDRARARHVPAVPPADFALYERLRAKLGGKALAQLKGEHCGGCGIQLPRPRVEAVQAHTALVTCGHCGRILYD